MKCDTLIFRLYMIVLNDAINIRSHKNKLKQRGKKGAKYLSYLMPDRFESDTPF